MNVLSCFGGIPAPPNHLLPFKSSVPSHVTLPTFLRIAIGTVQICKSAERLGIHHIVMGTARKNSLTRLLEDSVTHRVLEITKVPVEVVTGDAVSKWERWGLPAGVLGAGGLLVLAAD